MKKTRQSQSSDLKLTFHILVSLCAILLNIGLNGALFHFVWLPYKQFIPFVIPLGLVASMLSVGIITPFFTSLLNQHNPNKAFCFLLTGLIALISYLGIDCFRLVDQQFNPKHTTKTIDFLWCNLRSRDFTLERLSDELHTSIFHSLYYFGTLTLSILLFYKKNLAIGAKNPLVIHDEEAPHTR